MIRCTDVCYITIQTNGNDNETDDSERKKNVKTTKERTGWVIRVKD